MALLILGSTGQVGSALLKICASKGKQVISWSRKEVDFSQPSAVAEFLEKYFQGKEKPSAVINAIAYTQVDQAEKEEDTAKKVNAETPGKIACWCAENDIPFIHYSTDYVFPGDGNAPWKESDSVGPLNAYGRTKLEGEKAISSAGGKWLIFRTSWVYDATGKNFIRTMLRLGAERESLRVVSDQWGAPSFATHLAEATLAALKCALRMTDFPSGIYHLCNSGVTHWQGFAVNIFEEAKKRKMPLKVVKVEAISSAEYPTPARRPLNSRLDLSKLEKTFDLKIPDWKEGLNQCMDEIADLLKGAR